MEMVAGAVERCLMLRAVSFLIGVRRVGMRLLSGLSLLVLATGASACAAHRGDDDFVYFRTVPMTAAAADSLGAVLLAQRLGVSHVAAFGPEVGAAARRGMLALEAGSASPATRSRIIAWLEQRPEIVAAGLDKEAVWTTPNAAILR